MGIEARVENDSPIKVQIFDEKSYNFSNNTWLDSRFTLKIGHVADADTKN